VDLSPEVRWPERIIDHLLYDYVVLRVRQHRSVASFPHTFPRCDVSLLDYKTNYTATGVSECKKVQNIKCITALISGGSGFGFQPGDRRTFQWPVVFTSPFSK
jgi:hypothetical protein